MSTASRTTKAARRADYAKRRIKLRRHCISTWKRPSSAKERKRRHREFALYDRKRAVLTEGK